MDDATRSRQAAVRKETTVSAVMNVVIGSVFFLLVFGWNRTASASIALDFLPQTMGMTFLGGMVASLICLSKVAAGTLVPAGTVPTRGQQAIRVLGIAVGTTAVFGGAVALLVARLGPAEFDPATALAIKSLYGIVMALVTTPPIVRMALGMPFRRQSRLAVAGARP